MLLAVSFSENRQDDSRRAGISVPKASVCQQTHAHCVYPAVASVLGAVPAAALTSCINLNHSRSLETATYDSALAAQHAEAVQAHYRSMDIMETFSNCWQGWVCSMNCSKQQDSPGLTLHCIFCKLKLPAQLLPFKTNMPAAKPLPYEYIRMLASSRAAPLASINEASAIPRDAACSHNLTQSMLNSQYTRVASVSYSTL